ncbi:MAG TPA: hypothetical protein VG222_18455 [Vicinamibacterales bacterium]|jgi:hypothetical protein|nr:hypothetical protein [Vicinamibacterales bacterium]
MTVLELLRDASREPDHAQLHVNAFVDAFRRARPGERSAMIACGPSDNGRIEGLASAVVSALCRETETPSPPWVRVIHSPEPFFVMPATGFALRVRLMLESPLPFHARNVFVPENYLSRA